MISQLEDSMAARPHVIDGKTVDPKRAVPRDENGGSGGGASGGRKASQLTMDGQRIELNAAKIRLEAQQEILLTCGESTIRITPGDIQILSPTDRLNC